MARVSEPALPAVAEIRSERILLLATQVLLDMAEAARMEEIARCRWVWVEAGKAAQTHRVPYLFRVRLAWM
jgi:hypothetical protein